MKHPQFTKIKCRHGAPMGRAEWVEDFIQHCRCFRVRLVDGDYDEGGAYWGGPPSSPLYCCTNGEGVQLFTRSTSRKNAKAYFNSKYPDIKWIN